MERQDSTGVLGASQKITFSWSNLTVKVAQPSRRCCGLLPAAKSASPPKTIIDNVSGVVRPGEFLAILGASGAGKSTLLNTLLFRNLGGLEVTGNRLANNKKVTPNSLTAVSAYVQQDDLFFGTFTIREQLVFQALLRMDKHIPYQERMRRVEEVITELGLSKSADVQIGIPGRIKGISGGEMKRLAFACEVLTNPPILFCDEPTSGLDSFMAASVVELLGKMARQGRTVICTIHQPSSQIVQLFDKVLLMAEGKTAYLGDVAGANRLFERCGFSCPPAFNPADHFIQVLAVVPGKEEECRNTIKKVCTDFSNSEEGKELIKIQSESEQNGNGGTKFSGVKSPYKATWAAQFRALFWRSWLSVIKNPLILRVRLLQSVGVALIFSAIYFGQDLEGEGNIKGEAIMNINGALFLTITNTTFSNMFAVINVFCLELPIFLREHFNGMYRTDVYFLTKQLAELPFFVIFTAVFLSILYFMVGFNGLFAKFMISLGILELLTQCVVSFGYMVSCLAPSLDVALGVAPAFMVPLMLFGGLFLNNGSAPVYLVWLKYFSWFLYSNEALSINQWSGLTWECPQNSTTCFGEGNGDVVLDQLNFDKDNLVFDIIILGVLTVGFRILAYFFLLLKTLRKK